MVLTGVVAGIGIGAALLQVVADEPRSPHLPSIERVARQAVVERGGTVTGVGVLTVHDGRAQALVVGTGVDGKRLVQRVVVVGAGTRWTAREPREAS